MAMNPPRRKKTASFASFEELTWGQIAGASEATQVMREELAEVCLLCGGVGTWASPYSNAPFSPPPGHVIETLPGHPTIQLDACPQDLRV